MQRKHVEFETPKGAQGGFSLPFLVLREANARYYEEDLSPDVPTDIILQPETGHIRVLAIGGPIALRANNNVSKGESVKATAVLTLTGAIVPATHAVSVLTSDEATPEDGSSVVIGDRTYTFVTALTGGTGDPDEVLIGADEVEALANLKAAINGEAGEGTTYGTGTVPHADVVATASDSTTLDVQARAPGVDANALATTASTSPDSHMDWADTTLGGGTGSSNPGVTTAAAQVTVRDVTYTFVDALSEDEAEAIPNQVLFGADSAAALDNLKLAVNGGATEGTNYSTGTEQPDDVLATTNTDTAQTFEAQTLGEPGNEYEVSETLANGSFGVGITTFTGGSEGANYDALIPAGEALDVGVDESVQAISVIAFGASTDVAVVEY